MRTTSHSAAFIPTAVVTRCFPSQSFSSSPSNSVTFTTSRPLLFTFSRHVPHRPIYLVTMRRTAPKSRPWRRQGQRRRDPKTHFSDVLRTAQSAWSSATPTNRLLISTLLIVGISISAAVVNILLHVSFMLAFALVPLMLAPILFTVVAGLGVFALLATATAGAGIFFVGTPFVMVAVFAKALLPVFVTAMVFNWGAKTLGFVRDEIRTVGTETIGSTRTVKNKPDEDDYDDNTEEDEKNEFEEFDQLLKRRTGVSTSAFDDVEHWGLNEVVDELDACGLGRYRQLFIDERIDGNTLLSLTDADIREEFADSMPLGDRRRLSRLVSSLRRRTSRLP